MDRFKRSELIIGTDAQEALRQSKVIVFGIGGVGSYVAEALARAGIGSISLVDSDVVCESNINRQIIALESTIGKPKTEVMKSRIEDINSECDVKAYQVFYTKEKEIDISCYD